MPPRSTTSWSRKPPSGISARTVPPPAAHIEGSGRAVVSQAERVLLVETVRKTGLE
ncbi:hypothetical protein [Streptomyces sp. NPDC050121]|uniref:hypothetical protein n=1 Tax=Streptomyces sp. NPDC050121 TaxID=3365601 RepID=UPI003787C58A